MKYLSEGLFDELILEKNTKILKDIQIFSDFSQYIVKKLFISFKEELLGLSDNIFDENEDDQQLVK